MRSQIAYILEYWCILMNCSLVFEMSDSLNLSNQPLIITLREFLYFFFNPEKYRSLTFAWNIAEFYGFIIIFHVIHGGGDLVTKYYGTLVTPWTVVCQAPLSMGFSRWVYWSGLPFPSPGDRPNPEIEPRYPALQADSLLTELRVMTIKISPLIFSYLGE